MEISDALRRELLELERERKKLAALIIVLWIMGVAGVALIIPMPPVGILLLFGAIAGAMFPVKRMKKQYVAWHGRLFTERILKHVFANAFFSPEEKIPESMIGSTEMIKMGNRYLSNNYVQGSYKGIPFRQANVSVAYHATSRSIFDWSHVYFYGRWMIFTFPRSFATRLQIREKGFRYAVRSINWFSGQPQMHRLYMGDMEFDKVFRVFAMDSGEVYSLLTPHRMESLRHLQAKTRGKLLLGFVNNELHIAVRSRKNAFEARVFSKIHPDTAFQEMQGDVEMITQFIDGLMVDKDVFKEKDEE